METPATILEYWFGSNEDDAAIAEDRSALWWSKNPETDREIRDRFEKHVVAADAGDYDSWSSTPQGILALILLTDQFPRNIYRDTPDAFRFDATARDYSLRALSDGADRHLRPIHRVFVYMPLEHSENIEHQNRCVDLFEELLEQVDDELTSTFEHYLDFAIRHQRIIARFGRFPHRNEILGRRSTAEEIEFLKEPGSSF